MRHRAWLAALLLLGTLEAGTAQAQAGPRKLNVLLIVADDLNTHLGCYGNAVVKTPHLDRLAARGVRFDRAYCNYPVCNPSRTSFLSGRYPETTRVFGNTTPPRSALGNGVVFLPELFRAAGYFTARVGKVAHTPFEDAVTWDVSETARKAGPGKGPKQKGAAKGGGELPFAWQATDRRDEDEPDGRTARRVVQLLEQHKDRPFFIAAGFSRPHVPHTAPKKYFDLYPPEKMPLPKAPPGGRKNVPAIARGQKYFPNLTAAQQRQIIAHYYAVTTFMDAQVGGLLEALDRLRLWDSTVVIFVSDHGWHLGDHGGQWAKFSLLEASARVPLLVAAPGKATRTQSPRVVELIDLYPTLAELCGLKAPPGLEGRSFAPLLSDPGRPWERAAYTVMNRKGGLGRSLRTERYTWIEWPDGSVQLYDFARDPGELVNLANDPAHAATLRAMRQRLPAAARAGKR